MSEGRKLSPEEKDAIMRGDLKEAGLKPDEKVEEKAEEKAEEKIDEKVEAKTEEKADTEEKTEEDFNFSVFGEKFGREIGDEESLKSLFEKADKYEETSKSYKETSQKLTEYQTIAEKADPMANFLNEDEYKRQQLLIKKGDELSPDAVKELSVLNPTKVKELSDEEALRVHLMVDKSLTKTEADAYLLNKYGIEEFGSEDTEAGVKAAIKVDAIDARRNVEKLYDGIDIPTKTDYESARVQLKDSWVSPVQEIVNGIDKIQLEEGLDFVVTDEMKQGFEESTLAWVMSNQLKPSEEAGAQIVGMLRDQIVSQNLDKILKSAKADWEESFKADTRSKIHNDKPLDDTSRAEQTSEDNDSKVKRML